MIGWVRSLDRVLKGEATKPAALQAGTVDVQAGGLTVLLVVLGTLYGACMGAFGIVSRWGTPNVTGGWLQMGYSAAKVPMLFFLTLLITFPSLYVFNALVGCRLAFAAVVRLLVAALGVTLAVLASFGTIVVFFSLCTTSYPFMVLLNVVMFAVAGVLGMNFLLQTLHRLAIARGGTWEAQEPAAASEVGAPAPTPPAPEIYPPLPPAVNPGALEPVPRQTVGRGVRTVFSIWVIVFGLIGAQMGWVLRPFIGAPNAPVTFFRSREGNFFEAVANKVGDLAGEQQSWKVAPGGPTSRESGR
jgi:hypothetical protein